MTYFLHGNLGSAADWDDRFVGEKVDLWASSHLSLWDWALDFCGNVRAEKNILVGYSMGGRLALHALIVGGEKLWDGAVIIAAHPGLISDEDRKKRRARDRVLAEGAREWPWQRFLRSWNAQPVLAGGQPSASQLELENHREAIANGFENWSLGAQENLREKLANVTVPVRWLTGEHDEKFSAFGVEIADTMPSCEHRVVADCGHRILSEKPEAVLEALNF